MRLVFYDPWIRMTMPVDLGGGEKLQEGRRSRAEIRLLSIGGGSGAGCQCQRSSDVCRDEDVEAVVA